MARASQPPEGSLAHRGFPARARRVGKAAVVTATKHGLHARLAQPFASIFYVSPEADVTPVSEPGPGLWEMTLGESFPLVRAAPEAVGTGGLGERGCYLRETGISSCFPSSVIKENNPEQSDLEQSQYTSCRPDGSSMKPEKDLEVVILKMGKLRPPEVTGLF